MTTFQNLLIARDYDLHGLLCEIQAIKSIET